MKRNQFLASLLAFVSIPFLSSAEKKKENVEFVCRESTVVPDNLNNELGNLFLNKDAKARLFKSIESQIDIWETVETGFDGKSKRVRHFMVKILPSKEKQIFNKEMFAKRFKS